MLLPIELTDQQLELLAEAVDVLCMRRQKSAEHFAAQAQRKRDPAKRQKLEEKVALAQSDATLLGALADQIDMFVSGPNEPYELEEETEEPEPEIICPPCFRLRHGAHAKCGAPGCECRCNE